LRYTRLTLASIDASREDGKLASLAVKGLVWAYSQKREGVMLAQTTSGARLR
jgi:hypothetical protein